MSVEHGAKPPRLPPRWFIRLAWSAHRGVCWVFGGRVGLRRPRARGWGTLRLTTTGRRAGRQRSVILGYLEDGPDLVSLAMNGWGEGEPAWWLNLQTHPDATVDLVDGRRLVRGHAATGDERARLWARWREIETKLDAYAALRSSETAVVVLGHRRSRCWSAPGDGKQHLLLAGGDRGDRLRSGGTRPARPRKPAAGARRRSAR
jgi:F420H(2)-dependent quinone reductase